MTAPRIGAIVLAAGFGSRLGQPKALAVAAGRSLLLVEVLRDLALGLEPVVVVLGAEGPRAADLLLRSTPSLAAESRLVLHQHEGFALGQTSSLLAGLSRIPADCEAFLIQPLDHAFVRRKDLSALLDAARAPGPKPLAQRILRPYCAPDRYGHPVLFGRDYAREFEALSGRPANLVERRHRALVELVPVDNPNIHKDVDHPEDLERLAEHFEKHSEG